jgi:hypothetical protein
MSGKGPNVVFVESRREWMCLGVYFVIFPKGAKACIR